MLTAMLRSLRTGVVTIRYPEDPAHPPERFRGAPAVRPGSAVDEAVAAVDLSVGRDHAWGPAATASMSDAASSVVVAPKARWTAQSS